jgi:hypothetical protein
MSAAIGAGVLFVTIVVMGLGILLIVAAIHGWMR